MTPSTACSDHREEIVSVTVTGWIVVQCRACGAGNVLPPPDGACGYPGCTTDHRREPANEQGASR